MPFEISRCETMSRYKFTSGQRFAVYTVHGAVCYLNGEPLYLKGMRKGCRVSSRNTDSRPISISIRSKIGYQRVIRATKSRSGRPRSSKGVLTGRGQRPMRRKLSPSGLSKTRQYRKP
jgi:hypothetical protein